MVHFYLDTANDRRVSNQIAPVVVRVLAPVLSGRELVLSLTSACVHSVGGRSSWQDPLLVTLVNRVASWLAEVLYAR